MSIRDALISMKGNKFVDPDGKAMLFRGLSISDPDKLQMQGRVRQSCDARRDQVISHEIEVRHAEVCSDSSHRPQPDSPARYFTGTACSRT